MFSSVISPVGWSRHPAGTANQSSRVASDQKSEDPHCEQNPYRTVEVRWYHVNVSSFSKKISLTKAAVAAIWWPVKRRHGSQWQLITFRKGPITRYRTPPQIQPPVAVTFSSDDIDKAWHNKVSSGGTLWATSKISLFCVKIQKSVEVRNVRICI